VLEGILNLDKPAGITSHDAVNQIRRLAGQRRVGHAGTLDPLATGVLLLGLGRATRLLEYLAGQPKRYEGTIRLGQVTTTYDAEGEIVAELPVTVSEDGVRATLDQFRGPIVQIPPAFSAIKRAGQPLYKLARRGLEFEPPPRQVTIYELELLSYDPPFLFIGLECSAGTYVRSLANDLGQSLGCGGHLTALRRTAFGAFVVSAAASLDSLTAEKVHDLLLPPDAAVAHLPRLDLGGAAAESLRHGRPVPCQSDHPAAALVRVYDPAGLFLGVAARGDNGWQAQKILV
jgi:tRNA pseudouridine55 synthase